MPVSLFELALWAGVVAVAILVAVVVVRVLVVLLAFVLAAILVWLSGPHRSRRF